MTQASILAQITAQRRADMANLAQQEHYALPRIEQHIRRYPRPRRSLATALRQPHKGFILECKKASPSKGLIRPQFDPVGIAAIYQRYAAAISVLTEPTHFQGNFAYLQAVSSNVHVPVICKDFITTPLHVYLARYYGADAILLMLSVLDDTTYQQLATLAHDLDMEVLTEVSTQQEMRRASALQASIIGINHRNLHDLSIDLERTAQLAPLAPANALLVAESGISNNQQVRTLGKRVDGYLVGSHLTAQQDIDRACRALIFGTHKVCGVTSASAAIQAAAAGATYAGLIFAPKSPRYLTPVRALEITKQAPELDYVAVVTANDVNQTLHDIGDLPCAAIQLHGQQSIEFIALLRAELKQSTLRKDTELWYALDMSSVGAEVASQIDVLISAGISKVVLDQGQGGSGQTFNWTCLQSLTAQQRASCVLAGGLSIDNIVQAAQLGLAGLDINSGLEVSPGVKDPALVHSLFTQLASYYRNAPMALQLSEETAS